MRRAAPALLLATLLLACAGLRSESGSRRPRAELPEGPAGVSAPPGSAEVICAPDRVATLRARFHATVRTATDEMVAEGILLVRRPGALRIKLFGVAGFTVHDAVWIGDGSRVRGVVQGFGVAEAIRLEQTPARPIREPAARLSLLLWSLWQPRCASPPTLRDTTAPRAPDVDLPWVLNPSPAQALGRVAVVEEGELRTETLRTADGEQLTVRSSDFDRSLRPPLARRIVFQAPAAGWSAEIQVSDYAVDEPLAEALFELPAEGAAFP